MIDENRFNLIRSKHGGYASWAVWSPPTDRPKSNMGDLSVLDVRTDPCLLDALNPSVVMAGLNVSGRTLSAPFANFHDPSPAANDFKIRFAFSDTDYWGAYMTDVIKDYPMLDSRDVLDDIRKRPALVERNIAALREEFFDLDQPKPVVLAFGHAAHALLAQYLDPSAYSVLVRLTHYAHYISKENYRTTVLAQVLSTVIG